MLTSGIFDNLYVVNEKYYTLNDDITCFNLSKIYHSLPKDCFIEMDSCKLRYGKVKNTKGNNYLIYWYDEYKPGTTKFRVYEIKGR